jgi:hypothetical protein
VAVLLLGAGFALAMALGISGAVAGLDDASKYGPLSLPGRAVLDLPEGDVAVYYEERVTLHEDQVLNEPPGLRVRARGDGGGVVEAERVTPNAINATGRSAREFAKLRIPREGSYRVTARAVGLGSNSPAVTLGIGQWQNLADAAKRAALLLGGALVLALVVLFALRRPEEEAPPGPSSTPPTAGPGPTSIRL